MKLDLKKAEDYKKIERKPREMSIAELRDEIKELSKDKIDTTRLYIAIHKKLALAFSNIAFILIGIPIAISTHRREKSINFALTFLLFVLYWCAILGGVACAMRGIVPAWAGVWMANILLFLIGGAFFVKLIRK